ncbi:3-oxoacyl-[acyl-carrier-protein] synthase [Plakobranchus ocellatus]|uniref:3-oxoacyl-[acyl-carrier-protein] synthase n=1 Tax=Plakobranchus ocellatus TaxID=259542 RepID=A0AAV4CLU8_9GAST|nr:3-oxoacyl-[acyl-carrier-protein] synthase [Plakobranchus ocellatus]
MQPSRRVVVTGMGVVNCLGVGLQLVWEKLLQGKSGITALTHKDFEAIPSKVAGIVPRGNGAGQFNSSLLPKVSNKAVSQMTEFSLVAAEEALTMSGWKPERESDRQNTGVCIGTGMAPLEEIADAGEQLRQGNYRKISPWFIPRITINMAAAHVNLAYGFKGPCHAVSTACTTGLHAIGDASRFIRCGDASVIVAGGCEASATPLSMAGFSRLRALSTNFNAHPESSSRPFDKDRDGFVMAEGAGVLVLEELEHARNRGAPIFAEVLGYGLSCDASHITSPSEDGSGARHAMEAALREAKIQPERIGHVNAHATSTPLGDIAESKAIWDLFGDHHAGNILVTSTKGATGHLLGGAGSIEAIFAIMACHSGQVPPTVNLTTPSTGYNLNYVYGSSVSWSNSEAPRIALTNSFGFGGTNGTLCLSEYVHEL